jgi:hypothetical protein
MLALFIFLYSWEELVVLDNASPQRIVYTLWHIDYQPGAGAGCQGLDSAIGVVAQIVHGQDAEIVVPG